jgi:hypothetical protein
VEHRDGPWIPREDQASLFTVIIYLNQNFEGGRTVLHGECAAGSHSGWGTKFPGVKPVTGLALVFNHDMLHAGEPVGADDLRGVGQAKWILRTEIVFERILASPELVLSGKYKHLTDKAFIDCVALYDQSFAKCEAGDKHGFMSDYQAVVLQQRAAAEAAMAQQMGAVRRSPNCRLFTATAGAGIVADHLNADALGDVLRFLSDTELVVLMSCSRRCYLEIATSPMWRARCIDRFGDSLPRAIKATAASAISEHIPWLSVYLQQLSWSRFSATSLWFLSDGCLFAAPADVPKSQLEKYPHSNRLYGSSTIKMMEHGGVTAAAKWQHAPGGKLRYYLLPDVYGGLQFSFPMHCNFPNSESYTIGYQHDAGCRVTDAKRVCDAAGQVELSVLVAAFDHIYDTVQVPMLLVDHPQWSVHEQTMAAGETTRHRFRMLRQQHVRNVFEVLRTPAVACLTTAQCVCFAVAFLWNCGIDQVNTHLLLMAAEGVLYLRLQCGRPVVTRVTSVDSEVVQHELRVEELHAFASDEEWSNEGDPWVPLAPLKPLNSTHWQSLVRDGPRRVTVVRAGADRVAGQETWQLMKAGLRERLDDVTTLPNSAVLEGASLFTSSPSFRNRCCFRIAPEGYQNV